MANNVRPERSLPLVALDTETTGPNFLENDRPFSVALAWPGDPDDFNNWKTKWYCWPVDPFSRAVKPNKKEVKELRQLVNTHRIVFHNAKFDIRALESVGIHIPTKLNAKAYEWRAYEDTMLASHVCDSNESHKLKDLALKYLDIPDDDQADLQQLVISLRRKAKDLGWNIHSKVECDYWLPAAMALEYGSKKSCQEDIQSWVDKIEEYNVLDAKRTMALWQMYWHVMNDQDLLRPYFRERLLQFTIYRIETTGVTLNKDRLVSELKRYGIRRDETEAICQRIFSKLGFETKDGELLNIRSNPQLQAFLFGPKKQGCLDLTDLHSTDAEAIKLLIQESSQRKDKTAYEFLKSLQEYKLNKTPSGTLEGYLEKLKKDTEHKGRWYLSHTINQMGTDTTRCSHSNPNTANTGKGKEIDDGDEVRVDFISRSVFGPAWGRIWYDFDYNQLQLRIFAFAAEEESLIEGFRQGYDAHDMVAAKIFDMEVPELHQLPDAEYKLKRRIGKNTNFGFIFGAGDAKIDFTSGMKGLSSLLDKTFPNAKEFMQKTIRHVKQYGYVTTHGGYRLSVPRDRAYAGVCYIIQGDEGDICKNAMITTDNYVHQKLYDDAYITLQVHDSLVFDFPSLANAETGGKNPKSKTPESIYENSERLEHLTQIQTLMTKAGADLGIETPVNVERVVADWSQGEKMDLQALPIRKYRQTGEHKGHFAKYGGGNTPKSRKESMEHTRKVRARQHKEKQLARLSATTKRL